MNSFNLITSPNAEVEEQVKRDYPSFLQRTQFSKFWFRREKDANMFVREYNPTTTPGVDFITKAFVVQL